MASFGVRLTDQLGRISLYCLSELLIGLHKMLQKKQRFRHKFVGAIWSKPPAIELASMVEVVADAAYVCKEDLRRTLIVSNFRPIDSPVDPDLPLRWVLEQVFDRISYVRVLFLKKYGANLVGKSVPVCFCRVGSSCATVAHGLQCVLALSEYFEEPKREMVELLVHLIGPNAKVQGRALGMAEAIVRIGVPCNAQLGWWPGR
jgi:hypothetical protein